MGLILFFLGAAVGSFLKVLADRYVPEKFLFDKKVIGGRSHCPLCRAKLRWFELIPIFSYLFQKGKCRRCGQSIGLDYPLTEIVSGLIFVFVPANLQKLSTPPSQFYILATLWIFVFLILLLVSLIDFRLRIIPDEANLILLALGLLIIISQPFGDFEGTFLGPYGFLLGWRQSIWLNRLLATLSAAAFFFLLILFSKGRAMGVGDLKLASVIGFIFGWPDIILILIFSFILGALAGLGEILLGRNTLKGYLAFGPFLAAAAFLVFFFGFQFVGWYFNLAGLLMPF